MYGQFKYNKGILRIRRYKDGIEHNIRSGDSGVICSVVLSMGVPIALFIAGRVKLKARISSFFIGAGTYLLFAMLLEQQLHVLVIQFCGLNAQSKAMALLCVRGFGCGGF